MSEGAHQRVDVWLFRARLAKTRAEAAQLVSGGGVRLSRARSTHRLRKPSFMIAEGDVLNLPLAVGPRMVRVVALGHRRGPQAEARSLYASLDRHD